MRPDDDIHRAFTKLFNRFLHCFLLRKRRNNPDGKWIIHKALARNSHMLLGRIVVWYQDRRLFSIHDRLEDRTHGYFHLPYPTSPTNVDGPSAYPFA